MTTNLATGHRIIGRYLDLLPIDHADLRERSVDLWCESHPEAIPLAWAYAQEHDRPAVYATPGKSGDGWWTQVSWLENDVWVYVWADIEDPATIDRLTAVMVASRSDYARIVAAISGEAARTPEPAQTPAVEPRPARRRLCAHADQPDQPAHFLEPGETCPRAEVPPAETKEA